MAMCDYKACDQCGAKAFYDANVTDNRYCATWDPSEDAEPIGISVLCSECNKHFETCIRPRSESE